MKHRTLARLLFVCLALGGLSGCGPQQQYEATPTDVYPQNRKTLETLYDALHDYARDAGRFPDTLDALVGPVAPPDASGQWRGPYLPTLPRDAWDRPFDYRRTPDGSYPYQLASAGANGQPGDSDDFPIDEVRRLRMERDLKVYAFGVFLFRAHVGRYPTTEEGLASLLVQPPNAPGWRGPYSTKVLRDPWNHDFQYSLETRNGQPYHDIWSWGPDGKPGADDIHVRQIPNTEKFFIPESEIEEGLARLRGQGTHDQPQ